jgi:recombinational DNA repair protein (RecF pathway)
MEIFLSLHSAYWTDLINRLIQSGLPIEQLYSALSYHLHLLLLKDIRMHLPKSLR